MGDIPKEICRRLFPRRIPGTQFENLLQLSQAPTTAERETAIANVQQALRDLPESTDMRGLRLDVEIPDPGAASWVDTSTVHTPSIAYGAQLMESPQGCCVRGRQAELH